MKKTLFVLCAAALMVGTVSCKKESVSPTTPSEEPGDDTQQPTYVEGVFNPGKHIASVTDGDETYQWSWNNASPKQLTGIASTSKIDVNPAFNFTYNADGTMSRSSISLDDVTANVNFSYNNGRLSGITLGTSLMTFASATPSYNADNKLNQLRITGENLQSISSILSSLLGGSKVTQDITFDSASLTDHFTWTGDNITTEAISGIVTCNISIRAIDNLAHDMLVDAIEGYLPQYLLSQIDVDSLLSEVASALADSTIRVVVRPQLTMAYTFDTNNNPFRGFWGSGFLLQPQAQSVNNMLTSTVSDSISLNINFHLPQQRPEGVTSIGHILWGTLAGLVNSQSPIKTSFPASQFIEGENRTYQYSGGYPTSYNNGDDTVTYTYSD